MKTVIASDIHGSAYYCRLLLKRMKAEKADTLLLLGDTLYHGPRNDLPRDYAPKEVTAMLTALETPVFGVRGNCDAEIDQTVLGFPIMADYSLFVAGRHKIFVTHGHLYTPEDHPKLCPGDAFLFGHARRFEVKGRRYLDSPMKYYATDLGLRNARLNFRDVDPSHPMENAIYNELLRRGCNVDVGVVPVSSRDADGRQSIRQHEIDFVVNRGNDKIYIQSAFRIDDAAKERQETLPLRKTGDFFKKIVVTEGYGEARSDTDGIIRIGVIPFLLDETILKHL